MSWMAKLSGLVVVLSVAACAAPDAKNSREKTVLSPDAAEVVEKEGKVEASTEENKTDSNVVCERVKVTGSNLRETRCYTVAERDKRRERTQEEIRDAQQGGFRADDQ